MASAVGTGLVFRTTQAAHYGAGPFDSAHPGQAGHSLDALWMARELRRLILSEFA
jgi:hypothetical protein